MIGMKVRTVAMDQQMNPVVLLVDKSETLALPIWIGTAEAAIAIEGPLHWRAHAVPVAEIDIVAHADLVAVIEHRRAGHGQ